MKKLALFIAVVVFALALIDGVIQTSWAKGKIVSILQKNLKESEWSVQIEKVQRAFPDIDVEGLTLTSPDFELTFGKLQADLSFRRLWKKEIVITNLKADEVKWKVLKTKPEQPSTSPPSSFRLTIRDFELTNATLFDDFVAKIDGSFSLKQTKKKGIQIKALGELLPNNNNPFLHRNWEFGGKLSRENNSPWLVDELNVSSDISQIAGSGVLTPQGKLSEATLKLQSDLLAVDGTVFAKILCTKEDSGLKIAAKYSAPFIDEIKDVQGEITSFYADGKIDGKISAVANYLKNTWEIKSPFSFEKELGITFSQGSIVSNILQLNGDLQINPQIKISTNGVFNSGKVHAFFPKAYGEVSGKFYLRDEGAVTFLSLDTTIDDAYFGSFFAKKLSIYSDIENPFGAYTGTAVCDVVQGKWKELIIDEATLETTKEGENFPFSLTSSGKWVHPLDLNANGFWSFCDDDFIVSLQSADGSFFNHSLLLQEPVSLSWSTNVLKIGDFTLELGSSTINGSFVKEEDGGNANLQINSLPIDFLSLNPLDVDVGGSVDLNLGIVEKGASLSGKISATLDNLEMRFLGEDEIKTAQGKIEGSFDRNELKVYANIVTSGEPFASLDLRVPIHFELFPPLVDPYYHRQMQGHVFFRGQVEEILDFFNLKSHRIEGTGSCDLSLAGTLEKPHLFGKCTLSNGYYQNYYTGTELKNISATFDAEKNAVALTSFKATDPQDKGTFFGKGKINLKPKENFPFSFNLSFSNVNLTTFDLIRTEGSGSLQIFGDLSKATASGNIEIIESEISIPSRIPKEVPVIEVTFINAKAPPFAFELPEKNPYPLNLNLKVNAPDQIYITGRGLDSEWKGQFLVEGEQTNLEAKGQIELIKGQFTFSGRVFKLKEGSLIFTGTPNKAPVISLSADLQVKDILITATVQGALNNPQITLQSSPPLPMGSIMSYLLFGEELAEINSFQALQLANSAAAIAGGEAPSIIESSKKSIGIDQFEIISIPDANPDGSDKMAIQVGKYVSDGVLVSLSQGADNSSSNIRIEVELKGNLSLILESDQANEQKQGKFSMRWAHTY